MTKKTLFLAAVLVACGDRVSLGEHGSSKEQLAADPSSGTEPPDEAPGQFGSATDAGPTGPSASDIEYIEVDESVPGTPHKINVDASCRVTDHTGIDAIGDSDRCKELFDVAVDPTPHSCGSSCVPAPCAPGTVRVHLKDGTDLVRDLAADRCSVELPSVPTHKYVYAVWYSVGGGQ